MFTLLPPFALCLFFRGREGRREGKWDLELSSPSALSPWCCCCYPVVFICNYVKYMCGGIGRFRVFVQTEGRHTLCTTRIIFMLTLLLSPPSYVSNSLFFFLFLFPLILRISQHISTHRLTRVQAMLLHRPPPCPPLHLVNKGRGTPRTLSLPLHNHTAPSPCI